MKPGVLFAGMLVAGAVFGGTLDDDRRAELDHLLKHDCGSCHGLTLEGGLGPALTAERMQDRSREYLRAVIREGVPGTAMPPWGPLLSEQDIAYLAAMLREGRP